MKLTSVKILMAAMLAAGVVVGSAAIASADESGDVEIKVRAPIDAVSCDTTPQTVTVLGLAIYITAASSDSGDGGGSGDGSGDGNDDDGGSGGGCAALTVGQSVEVKLASDAAPLTAVEIGSEGDSEDGPEIKAPIQAADATAQTIQVLGLTVDVSTAAVDGSDDEDSPDSSMPLDLSTLAPGQFVELKLDASKLPALVALSVDVKNFTNEVDVEVEDENGDTVDDADENGDVEDVEVSVDESVVVTAAPAPGAAPKRMVKKLHFTRTTNGGVVLRGLAKGRAKITVTRTANGVTTTGRRGVKVRGNTSRTVKVRLRHAR